jgi:hypothetical protein
MLWHPCRSIPESASVSYGTLQSSSPPRSRLADFAASSAGGSFVRSLGPNYDFVTHNIATVGRKLAPAEEARLAALLGEDLVEDNDEEDNDEDAYVDGEQGHNGRDSGNDDHIQIITHQPAQVAAPDLLEQVLKHMDQDATAKAGAETAPILPARAEMPGFISQRSTLSGRTTGTRRSRKNTNKQAADGSLLAAGFHAEGLEAERCVCLDGPLAKWSSLFLFGRLREVNDRLGKIIADGTASEFARPALEAEAAVLAGANIDSDTVSILRPSTATSLRMLPLFLTSLDAVSTHRSTVADTDRFSPSSPRTDTVPEATALTAGFAVSSKRFTQVRSIAAAHQDATQAFGDPTIEEHRRARALAARVRAIDEGLRVSGRYCGMFWYT